MFIETPALVALKKLHEGQSIPTSTKKQVQKPIEPHPTLRKGVFISSSKIRRRSTSHLAEDQEPLQVHGYLSEIETVLRAEQRDEEAGKKLFEHIKHFSFFQAINTKFPGTHFDEFGFTQLCTKLKYERVPTHKVLYQEGDSTNGKVYFVYSGQVNIYKRNSENPLQQTTHSPSPIMSLKTVDSSKLQRLESDESQPNSRNVMRGKHKTLDPMSAKSIFDEKLEGNEKYGQLELELRSGDFFGEQALIDWQQRQQTAITNEFCELLVLTRHDFKFLRENYDEKRKKLCSFLEEYVPQMANVNTWQLLDELICVVEEKTFERGTFIINEGESSDTFFIIFDGCCELIKNVRIDESTNLKDTLVSIKRLLRVAPTYTEPLSICTVQKGTFLGDEVVFGADGTYNFSVRVTSGFATMFVLEKSKFVQKFPKIVQEEIALLFKAKKRHYAHAIRTSLSKKYPNMEPTSPSPNSTAEKTADGKLLASQIVLVPHKGGDLNFKARTGIFRHEKNESNDILAKVTSPELRKAASKDLSVEAESKEYSPKKITLLDVISWQEETSPRRSPTVQQTIARTVSDVTKREEDSSPTKGIASLKEKICRRQVSTDARDGSYVSTSPIPKTRNLTERGSTAKKIMLTTTVGLPTQRRMSDRKSYDRLMESGEMTARDEGESIEYGDYGKISPLRENTYVDHVGSGEQTNRAVSVGRFHRVAPPKVLNLDKSERHEKYSEDMQTTLFELRRLLIGKDSNSKEFIMAKKRLNSKFFNTKPKYAVDKDGSIGKRLDVLLKPMMEKIMIKSEHSRNISEMNISASPVKRATIHIPTIGDGSPLKRGTIHIPSLEDSSPMLPGSATKRSNRPKMGTEVIFPTEGFSESLEMSRDRSVSLLPTARGLPVTNASVESQRRAINERKMAMLRNRFRVGKTQDLSCEAETSYEKIGMMQKNPSVRIRIQPMTSRCEKINFEKINPTFAAGIRPKA